MECIVFHTLGDYSSELIGAVVWWVHGDVAYIDQVCKRSLKIQFVDFQVDENPCQYTGGCRVIV